VDGVGDGGAKPFDGVETGDTITDAYAAVVIVGEVLEGVECAEGVVSDLHDVKDVEGFGGGVECGLVVAFGAIDDPRIDSAP